MEAPNESDTRTRNESPETDTGETSGRNVTRNDLETSNVEPSPFSELDPYRPARITSLRGETDEFLQEIQLEAVGFSGSNDEQLRHFLKDAEERAGWSQTRQDAFRSILRLGKPIPRRSSRIL